MPKKSLKQNIADFHYGKFSLPLAILLFLPAIFYFFIICAKNFLYKIKLLKEKKVPAKVICVGNLTTGGVGKTPVVIEIANYLTEKNERVAILSRGYGGKLKKGDVHLIKNYGKILIDDPDLSGDEVNLIAHKTKDASVVVSTNRLKGAEFASEKLNADFIIMDDGFSNRALYKNLQILLFDTEKKVGNGFVLPFGPLREPLFEIKRADKILFIEKGETKSQLSLLPTFNLPIFTCKMETSSIYNIKTGKILEKNQDIVAFAGIGQNLQFYQKLNDFKILKTFDFDDHFKYTQKTVDKINGEAKTLGAKAIVTTEKDAVKLLKFNDTENFFALKIKPDLNLKELLD